MRINYNKINHNFNIRQNYIKLQQLKVSKFQNK